MNELRRGLRTSGGPRLPEMSAAERRQSLARGASPGYQGTKIGTSPGGATEPDRDEAQAHRFPSVAAPRLGDDRVPRYPGLAPRATLCRSFGARHRPPLNLIFPDEPNFLSFCLLPRRRIRYSIDIYLMDLAVVARIQARRHSEHYPLPRFASTNISPASRSKSMPSISPTIRKSSNALTWVT